MKFSERWLREWVDPPISTGELAHKLTMAGLEVDSVEPAAPAFEGVVVGQVLRVEAHPDADKLRVCSVDIGTGETLTIVCGAPNVHEGMRAPTAVVGAQLPGGLKIKAAKLRGVASAGMLCSAKELGLAEMAEGLMPLPGDAPIGTDLRDYLALDDSVIDVDLTPNRADCLGIAGIARELGALTREPVQVPEIVPVGARISDRYAIEIEAPDACPRYLGRVLRGIDANAETPMWMRERLRRSGVRSLGPLVDVTNYVLLELGQPMHAFDMARLRDGIRVRFARQGEPLVLLDGREIALESDTLVIADAEKALALAGIMGGHDSGVDARTQDLFLECAFFRPEVIAGRARRYGLQTDSSHRFERGVDPELQWRAMERATGLLLAIAGGQAGPITEVSFLESLPQHPPIGLRRSRITDLLGMDIADAEVEDILRRLGMDVTTAADGWTVVAPGFRFDIECEADLIEEVGRVFGYEQLPSRRPNAQIQMAPVPEARLSVDRLRMALVDRGYQEVITYSFVDPSDQTLFDPDLAPIALANPLSADLAVMRTRLWPGLARVLVHNLNRQQSRVRIFEFGLTFISQDTEIIQKTKVGGAWCGSRFPEQWGLPSEGVDYFDLKADVEALLRLTGHADEFIFEACGHPALHPGQSARLRRSHQDVGWIGVLHPEISQRLGVSRPILMFELDAEALTQARVPAFVPLSRYPAVRRDLAVVVDEAVTAQAVHDCVSAAAGTLLQGFHLFDVYRGKAVDSGRKSLALGLILQDSSRTLTEQEIDAAVARVVADLAQHLGASLRE